MSSQELATGRERLQQLQSQLAAAKIEVDIVENREAAAATQHAEIVAPQQKANATQVGVATG